MHLQQSIRLTMNEIDKLYSNAGVKPLCQIPDRYCGVENVYPDFTPAKQLEVIKVIGRNNRMFKISYTYRNEYLLNNTVRNDNFEAALAGLLNHLWQDLTAEEQKQIKKILEG